jgi:hypothetical protein
VQCELGPTEVKRIGLKVRGRVIIINLSPMVVFKLTSAGISSAGGVDDREKETPIAC